MSQFLLIVLTGMALVTAAAIVAAVMNMRRALRAEKENAFLTAAFAVIKEKAERLHQVLEETTKARGVANAERKDLAEALDSDLVHRANRLFGRL